MEERIQVDKEAFLSIARIVGLDERHPQLDQLYRYIETVSPSFKVAEGMDLEGIEPMPSLMLPEE